MIDLEKATRTIQILVNHLIRGDYDEAERLTQGKIFSASEIETAIADYGRRLVSPPPTSTPRSVVEVQGSAPTQWSVYVDLWTAEEGRSDLTLEITLTDTARDSYDVQIDNIHAL